MLYTDSVSKTVAIIWKTRPSLVREVILGPLSRDAVMGRPMLSNVSIKKIHWLSVTCFMLMVVELPAVANKDESACKYCLPALKELLEQTSEDLKYANKLYMEERSLKQIKSKLGSLESLLAEHSEGLSINEQVYESAANQLAETLKVHFNATTPESMDKLMSYLEELSIVRDQFASRHSIEVDRLLHESQELMFDLLRTETSRRVMVVARERQMKLGLSLLSELGKEVGWLCEE